MKPLPSSVYRSTQPAWPEYTSGTFWAAACLCVSRAAPFLLSGPLILNGEYQASPVQEVA